MYLLVNEILQTQTEFLSSQLGIALQIAAVGAVLFSGAKYLNKKLDERITDKVQEKLEPAVKEICKQIGEVSNAIRDYQKRNDLSQKEFQSKTSTAIRYIDRAVMNIQGVKEDEYMKDES